MQRRILSSEYKKCCNLNWIFLMLLLFPLFTRVIFTLAQYLSRVNPEQPLKISIIITEQLQLEQRGQKLSERKGDTKVFFCVCSYMVQIVELLRIYNSFRWIKIQTTSFQEHSFCKSSVELLSLLQFHGIDYRWGSVPSKPKAASIS